MLDRDFSFIRLRDNLTNAHDLNESPIANLHYLGQVQLLPLSSEFYVQITNVPGGITLTAPQYFFVECDGIEFDVTSSFGNAQIQDAAANNQQVFEITNIQKDFGRGLVYLKIVDGANTWYSNKFLCTAIGSELTRRFDYRNTTDFWGTRYEGYTYIQAIRLSCYLYNYISSDNIKTYYRISTNQNTTVRALLSDIDEYIFEYYNAWTLKRLKRIVTSDTFYIEGVRNYLFEAMEAEERAGTSNQSSNKLKFDADEDDIYDQVLQIGTGTNPPSESGVYDSQYSGQYG